MWVVAIMSSIFMNGGCGDGDGTHEKVERKFLFSFEISKSE